MQATGVPSRDKKTLSFALDSGNSPTGLVPAVLCSRLVHGGFSWLTQEARRARQQSRSQLDGPTILRTQVRPAPSQWILSFYPVLRLQVIVQALGGTAYARVADVD